MKINLHTHTTFCDGKSTPEENILAAIEKGFGVLGFSGHSMYPFARSWHIAPRDFSAYEAEITRLKDAYKGKIQILLGYEADYFPGVCVPSKSYYKMCGLAPDYLIGSVHYVVTDKGHYSVDNSVEKVRANLIRLYGKEGCGMESVDGRKAVCEYFAAQREMLEKGDFEILGHPDVIKKRNNDLHFFNQNESWYIDELKVTADKIAKSGVIVEMNAGGMARGNTKDFLPSEQFLSFLYERKVPVLYSSDSHEVQNLDFAYEEAKSLAKKIGYKEFVYPISGKTLSVSL